MDIYVSCMTSKIRAEVLADCLNDGFHPMTFVPRRAGDPHMYKVISGKPVDREMWWVIKGFESGVMTCLRKSGGEKWVN